MGTQKNEGKVIITPFEHDPMLSPEVREFLKVLNAPGGVPLESLPPVEARKVLENAQLSASVDMSGIEESTCTIQTDGYEIVLNIVRPEGLDEVLPVFIFIHGGGWVLGDYPTHKRMVRDLVVLSGTAGILLITPGRRKRYIHMPSMRSLLLQSGLLPMDMKSISTVSGWLLSAIVSGEI